jgi:hypothetical protein
MGALIIRVRRGEEGADTDPGKFSIRTSDATRRNGLRR